MSKEQVIDAKNQADDAYEDEWVESEDEEQQPSDDEVDESDSESEEESPPDEESDDSVENEEAPADDELGFSFDKPADEKDDNKAPEWVREVRKQNRELKKQLKEQQAKQNSQGNVLRDEPTLADNDWDENAYQQDLQKWHAEKNQYDQEVKQAQEQAQKVYANYNEGAMKIKAQRPDFDEKQQAVIDVLSIEQQNLILSEVSEPAKLTYMLGGSPEKLNEIADLSPTQFLKQIGILEYQMTQSASKKRNPNKPKPKKHVVRGGAGGGDAKLTKLEAEAEKTGDRSKLIAYKREQKRKQ